MVMVHPENKARVEWLPSNDPIKPLTRVWRGYNGNGEHIERRESDTEKGQRQETAALFDMGWHAA